eukprot:TRINITY_DN78526_c0_g1_i1.p1 TRINITY_DN78526_c0_g1~~TRINITY_DN78526_c0_g1_i1.p1  ORF type:complete len:514 (+),score=95.59 TRINITY_DN78526_c0_g1_i1:36-1544(+)
MACLCGAQRLLLPLLLLVRCGNSWRTRGIMPDIGLFTKYVGKFCFDFKPVPDGEAKPKIGTIEVTSQGRLGPRVQPREPALSTEGAPCWGPCDPTGRLYLIVFDDEEAHGQIAKQQWGHMSCKEMLERANFAFEIDFSSSDSYRKSVDVHESVRPRFWYFTFAACGVQMITPPVFEIHAKNTLQGLQSEFGIDQGGCLFLQHLAALGFIGLGFGLRHVAQRATGAEALRSRPLLRMLLVSCAGSAAAASCLSLHLAIFAANGLGVAWLEVLGTASLVAAKAVLSVLQLLIAKGWALFYNPQELVQRQIIICSLGIIVLISLGCEIHMAYFHDWSAEIYMHESWPGTVILVLNLVLFVEAWRSMRDTYRLETSQEVRIFYVYVSGASLLYFMSLPVVCVLASSLDPWVRARYVDRVEVLCRFLSTCMLGYVLRPSRLDAMVNARMEGLETVGEPEDDFEGQNSDIVPATGSVPLMKVSDGAGYREASVDVDEGLGADAGLPAE